MLRISVLAVWALLSWTVSCPAQSLPKVLFYADPMRSDNHIVRRTNPAEPSPAERHFVAITKGIFNVHATQDAVEVSRERLKNYDAVVFFTAGNPPADREALVEWVRAGGAFTGIHSTANTYQGYAPFGEMLGAYYERRPWRTREQPLAKVRIKVEDRTHPATKHLGESFEITDDLYLYKNWDRSRVHVLLSMDPASLDMTKVDPPDRDMAIAWTKSFGEGRVFYTMLGDSEPVWQDERYQKHLIAGIQWTLQKPSPSE